MDETKLKKLLEIANSDSPAERLVKLKELLEITNEGLSRKEFLDSFKQITQHILNTEVKLIEKIDTKLEDKKLSLSNLEEEFNQVISEAKEESDSTLGGFRRKTTEVINNLLAKNEVKKKLKQIDDKIAEVDDKLASVRNGQDADEEKIISEVLSKIKVPEIDKSELEEFKTEIREMLDSWRRTRQFGGGGLSKIALESKFVDDETPIGTINSVNTIFNLRGTPNPPTSVKVFVNGARMRVIEDYTLSGKTITFITAPPTNSIIFTDYRT